MKIHLIGVGGTGMGALAILLCEAGHEVRGSDGPLYPPMSTQLARAAIAVAEGFSAANLDWGPDVVVVGNVCSADHVEVVGARARGLRLASFPSLLAETILPGRRSLVVAGTHGKTTTASIAAWLLEAAGQRPSWLIGGVPVNTGRASQLGAGEAIVLEGDEYDTAYFDKGSKFLHYRPTRAILTGVEYDHADIFADLDAVERAFAAFVDLIPETGELIVCADSPVALRVAQRCRGKVTRYCVRTNDEGPSPDAEVIVEVDAPTGGRRTSFRVIHRGVDWGVFHTHLLGAYNAGNAAAAMLLAHGEGVEIAALAAALARFRGVRRRQELVGIAQGVRIIDDFAHHPTAVWVTLDALRRRYPKNRLFVCFEPRSASSRRAVFLDGYARAFERADEVFVAPLFAAEKIPVGERLDPAALAAAITEGGTRAQAHATIDSLAQAVLDAVGPGDTVAVLSCGSFGGLARRLLRSLGDPLMFAETEDRAAIDALVTGYGLPPVADVGQIESLVVRDDSGAVVGCVNLQIAEGDAAYLFGLAVAPHRRGEGLGWVLADGIIRRARTLGARAVVLQTSDAADFFANRLGFRRVELEHVPESVRSASNFVIGARSDATCMILDLAEPTAGDGH